VNILAEQVKKKKSLHSTCTYAAAFSSFSCQAFSIFSEASERKRLIWLLSLLWWSFFDYSKTL